MSDSPFEPPSPPPAPAPPAAYRLPPPDEQTIDDDIVALSVPQRESPFSIIYKMLGALRQTGFAGIGIIVAINAIGLYRLLIVPIVLLVVALAVASWRRFTFQIVGDDLVVEQGVLSRERKTIPLGRIQAVTINQRLLHRMLGLVEAQVETAGSSGVELTLAAIDRPRAEALRRVSTLHGAQAPEAAARISAPPPDSAIPAPPTAGLPASDRGEQIVLSRSLGDLLKVALSSNPLAGLGTAIAGLAVFGSELSDLIGLPTDRTGDIAEEIIASPGLIAAAIVAFGLLFVLGSMIATIVPLHELTLFRTDRGLRSAAGLLNRRERIAPRERIQLISSAANPIQRRFGIRTVTLPTAGTSAGSDRNSSLIRLPGTSAHEEDELRELLLPGGVQENRHELANGISSAAINRWTAWVGFPLVLITGFQLAVFVGWVGLVALLWLPITAVGARINQRNWRWELSPEALEVQHGPITRVRTSMPVRKSQTIRLRRSLFHRRRGLASVRVSSAAGSVVVPHIELAQANALIDELLYRAETDPRPFM